MSNGAAGTARDLIPLIRQFRKETEADRRIAAPVVEQLVDERLCRLAVVPELGGLGLSTVAALDVYETLATAEPSVAWIAWNNSLPALFSRFLRDAVRSEIFADPVWLYANSTRPGGKAVVEGDGYRINGRWSLVSGCELAEWIPLMCLIEESGELRMMVPGTPDMRMFFVRRGDFEILDTWHVGGLRGTGSHDVVVADLFVPHERSVSPADGSTLDHPLGKVPIVCTLAAGFASQVLGMARAAIDEVVALGKAKITPGPMPDLRDRPGAQAAIAGSAAAVSAARAHLHDCTGRIWDTIVRGDAVTFEQIGDAWAAASHANEVARSTVDAMYAAAGTTALYVDCPLERAHRDIHAMFRHVIAQPTWLEQSGRLQFGLGPSEFMFSI